MFVENTYYWLLPKSLKNTCKRNQFYWEVTGCNVFMFSRSKLFSQVFLKDIGLRCTKFIIENRTLADQLLVAACNVLDLFVFVSYWDSHTLSQKSFLKMFTLQTTVAYWFFCSMFFGLITFIMRRSHDIHATLLWVFLGRTTFWPLWVIMCSLIFLDVDIP